MNRIDSRFAQLKSAGRKALVPFVTAGDPSLEATVPVMHALVAGGADVIELGVPFSDPSADGPVIQRAGERALAAGIGLAQVIAMVRRFRERNTSTPVVLMGYANPVERYDQKHGAGAFVNDAAAAMEPIASRIRTWTTPSTRSPRERCRPAIRPPPRQSGAARRRA